MPTTSRLLNRSDVKFYPHNLPRFKDFIMAGKKTKKTQTKRRTASVSRKSKTQLRKTSKSAKPNKSVDISTEFKSVVDSKTKSLDTAIKRGSVEINKTKNSIKKTKDQILKLKARVKKANASKLTATQKKQLTKNKKLLAALEKTHNTLKATLSTATESLKTARQELTKAVAANKILVQFEKDWAKKIKLATKKPKKKPAKKATATKATSTKEKHSPVASVEQHERQPLHTTDSTSLTNGLDHEKLEPSISDNVRLEEPTEVTSS